MRDGKVVIQFVEGAPIDFSINAGLDEVYKRLFLASSASSSVVPARVDDGVQLVIFGCFWIEAHCNDRLRSLMEKEIPGRERSQLLYKKVQRADIRSKLALLATFEHLPEPKRASQIATDSAELFELRNRLAHYKEKSSTIAGKTTPEELVARIDELPEAELITMLRPPHTEKHADRVRNAIEWIEQVYSNLYRTTTTL